MVGYLKISLHKYILDHAKRHHALRDVDTHRSQLNFRNISSADSHRASHMLVYDLGRLEIKFYSDTHAILIPQDARISETRCHG